MADFTYVLNDPTTPQLNIPYNLPPQPGFMDFHIDGYQGATQSMYTLEHQAACCYATIVNGITMANHYCSRPVNHWAAVNSLYVQPRAGKQLNAYYDRQALRFFYAFDPIKNAMIYAANSHDVVAHELGHAILDTLRPELFNMQAMEVWAFHESFGDINAILNSLQFEVVIDYILNETNNNIRQSNAVSKLAEEMGGAIYDLTGGRMGYNAGFLRNAVNSYTYVQPETLPRSCPDNQLCSEPHNFSRVFTGAWWDVLCGIYESLLPNYPSPKDALKTAKEVMGNYTYQALPIAPATVRFYDAVARAMLVIDKANNSPFNKIMNDVFVARGILKTPVMPMTNLNFSAFTVNSKDEVLNHKFGVAVRNKGTTLLHLPFHLMNVEVPGDSYYEFDGNGDCVNIIAVSGEELIEHAHACVEFLKERDWIRPDKMTPFELDSDGNLIRSHFACCGSSGGFNNAERPGEPEFCKPWKPANNAGCSCLCASCQASGCGKHKKRPFRCPGPLADSPNAVPNAVCSPYANGIWQPAPLGTPPLPKQKCLVKVKNIRNPD